MSRIIKFRGKSRNGWIIGDLLHNRGKVYISGPITGYDLEERAAEFMWAEMKVQEVGGEPINPMGLGLPDSASWEQHMRHDITLLLTCDGIIMLNGWENSKGARLEMDIAISLGMPIRYLGKDGAIYHEEQLS